ncbi:hypothetical protein D3C80_1217580 [compost metagenome]
MGLDAGKDAPLHRLGGARALRTGLLQEARPCEALWLEASGRLYVGGGSRRTVEQAIWSVGFGFWSRLSARVRGGVWPDGIVRLRRTKIVITHALEHFEQIISSGHRSEPGCRHGMGPIFDGGGMVGVRCLTMLRELHQRAATEFHDPSPRPDRCLEIGAHLKIATKRSLQKFVRGQPRAVPRR